MFMITIGGAALAQKPTEPEAALELPDVRDPARPAKIALFRAPGFPTLEAPAIDDAILTKALAGLPVDTLASADDVKNKLKIRDYDILILPYGSAFPLGAWTQIRAFIEHGGGLVVLGGAPFHWPVRYLAEKGEQGKPGPGRWVPGTRQPTFARELLIGPAEKINITDEKLMLCSGAPWGGSMLKNISYTFALTLRFTTKKDFDKEDGTSGPRDAIARPIFHMVRANDQIPTGCPLIEIDRIRGSEAGARWVFVTSDAALDAEAIRECAVRSLAGAVELDARPVYASIEPGENANIRISLKKPFIRKGETPAGAAKITAYGPDGGRGWSLVAQAAFSGPAELRTAEAQLLNIQKPGLYTVEVEVAPEGGPGAGAPMRVTTGFWVRDAKLLKSGPKITVSLDWLRKDGVVFPIVGTTYMASDVHRKFLFEPNPYLWNRDFATMREQGVNFVRTGLWTGWQRAMLDPGAIDEATLRALDAYVMTAARHGIIVCFNFFAFQPPAFGGSNPYLDPRSLEGQKTFVALVARRYRDCNWIHYDLINEPSYCPPENLWSNRPIGDDHEKREWAQWIHRRFGDDLVALRDMWREPWGDIVAIPKPEDFNYAMTRESKRPRKAADFNKFSHEVVTNWAGQLRTAIRDAGGDVLVTLGQDEGGAWMRPSQQLYASSVDYTAIHTWWNNDDLLWDGIVTKVPGKPNVIQETGLMRLEDIDGFPWRTPKAAAELLERKFAFAFASRGAGAIEWAWNINPYMPVENESVIGIWRPDGTAKPELSVMKQFGDFFTKAAPLLEDYAPSEVLVVLPHSRLFAGRQKGVDAVKEIVRALAENFSILPTVVSEMRLRNEHLAGVKLVIVPSAEMLETEAAVVLNAASRSGIKVLFTGWVEGDPYGALTQPLAALGICDAGTPVSMHEKFKLVNDSVYLTFDDNRGQWLRKSNKNGGPDFDKDTIWHEPLPVEFARDSTGVRKLLAMALSKSGVDARESNDPVKVTILHSLKVSLVVAVNETSADLDRAVRVDAKEFKINVRAGRSKMLLINRANGEILASTE